MKLKSLGANKTEITLPDGAVIFFSYETPVAAQLAEGGFIRTETRWSVTTSKHINQWLVLRNGIKAKEVPQAMLDDMVS